jgi:hypothetical protein
MAQKEMQEGHSAHVGAHASQHPTLFNSSLSQTQACLIFSYTLGCFCVKAQISVYAIVMGLIFGTRYSVYFKQYYSMLVFGF